MGQVREPSAEGSVPLDVSEPDTGKERAGNWSAFSGTGSGATDLGPATRSDRGTTDRVAPGRSSEAVVDGRPDGE